MFNESPRKLGKCQPFALESVWEREAFAFVADLGVYGFTMKPWALLENGWPSFGVDDAERPPPSEGRSDRPQQAMLQLGSGPGMTDGG
jgi:hypothetical protein